MTINEDLKLKFDPGTIEHLGIKMYSRLPSALAELIANSYDADATEVHVQLFDDNPETLKVVVTDNGEGMSFEDINNNFLVIGRKRRITPDSTTHIIARKITGRKGLGKLALFGIGKTIEIITCKTNSNVLTTFTLKWEDIISEKSGEYHPQYKTQECDATIFQGTSITVSDLKRTSAFNSEQIILSLSKLFNFFDDNFKVFISRNGEAEQQITKDDRIKGIEKQFEWNVKDIIMEKAPDFEHIDDIKGIIISSKKPLNPDLRGITLYAHGRQANESSFFGLPEAGHTFSYLTGWIEADYIDEFEDDLISTDRQLVDWENPLMQKLQEVLKQALRFIVGDWSKKRSEDKIEKISERTSINVPDWLSKVPTEMKNKLENLITSVSKKPEIDDATFDTVVKDINSLIPEYTFFHYRFLHDQIKDSSKIHYENKQYYNAFIEAMKRYKNQVKAKSCTTQSEDLSIMTDSFGKDKTLITTNGFIRPNGVPFDPKTIENIEEGQKFLSMGIVTGGRNVVTHEEINDLQESKLFTEKDCLDLLSLLSHLFKRLDESSKK